MIIDDIKNALGITGDDQDSTLSLYIQAIKDYMVSAGVSYETVESDKAIGCIIAGVTDTWQYGGGEIKLSPFTKERIIQLRG